MENRGPLTLAITITCWVLTTITSWFCYELFFDLILTALRASIAVFLVELTPRRRYIWITRCCLALNLAHGVAYFFDIMLRCRPLNYYWNRIDPTKKGTCLSAAFQT